MLDGSVNSITKLPAVHEGRQRTRKTPCISESDKTFIITLGEIFPPKTTPFKERCETKVKYSQGKSKFCVEKKSCGHVSSENTEMKYSQHFMIVNSPDCTLRAKSAAHFLRG